MKYRYHLDAADIWNGMIASYDDDYLYKVREALDERQLVLANLCVDGARMGTGSGTARGQLPKGLGQTGAAEILGAKTVRIDMGGRDQRMTDEQLRLHRAPLQGIRRAGFTITVTRSGRKTIGAVPGCRTTSSG